MQSNTLRDASAGLCANNTPSPERVGFSSPVTMLGSGLPRQHGNTGIPTKYEVRSECLSPCINIQAQAQPLIYVPTMESLNYRDYQSEAFSDRLPDSSLAPLPSYEQFLSGFPSGVQLPVGSAHGELDAFVAREPGQSLQVRQSVASLAGDAEFQHLPIASSQPDKSDLPTGKTGSATESNAHVCENGSQFDESNGAESSDSDDKASKRMKRQPKNVGGKRREEIMRTAYRPPLLPRRSSAEPIRPALIIGINAGNQSSGEEAAVGRANYTKSQTVAGDDKRVVPSLEDFNMFVHESLRMEGENMLTVDNYSISQVLCVTCLTTTANMWRTYNGLKMCNACGLYAQIHGEPRPKHLQKKPYKSRNQYQKKRTSSNGSLTGDSAPRSKKADSPPPETSDIIFEVKQKLPPLSLTNYQIQHSLLLTPNTPKSTACCSSICDPLTFEAITSAGSQNCPGNRDYRYVGEQNANQEPIKAPRMGDFVTLRLGSTGALRGGFVAGCMWQNGDLKFVVHEGFLRTCHAISSPATADDFVFLPHDERNVFTVNAIEIYQIIPTALQCNRLFSTNYSYAHSIECQKCTTVVNSSIGNPSNGLRSLASLADFSAVDKFLDGPAEFVQRCDVYGLSSGKSTHFDFPTVRSPLEPNAMETYASRLLNFRQTASHSATNMQTF